MNGRLIRPTTLDRRPNFDDALSEHHPLLRSDSKIQMAAHSNSRDGLVWIFLLVIGASDPSRAYSSDDDIVISPTKIIGEKRHVIVRPEQFGQWVFQSDAENGRKAVESQLQQRIGKLCQERLLSDQDVRRLRLAGSIDIKRFFDQINDLKKRLELADGDLAQVRIIAQQAVELGKKRTGLFESGSFFDKAVQGTLAVPGPSETRNIKNINEIIRSIEVHVKLAPERRTQLFLFLSKEIRPRKEVSDLDGIIDKYQFAELPESKLAMLFDDFQWPRVRQLQDYFLDFGPVLARHGLIQGDVILASRNTPFRRHYANLEATVRSVEKRIRLNKPQREAFLQLLLRELPIPAEIGDFDDMAAKYGLSQIPEKTLRPLFDDPQWIAIQSVRKQFLELKPLLVQKGVIDAKDVGQTPDSPTNFVANLTETDLPADAMVPVNGGTK